jgi:hypothetical protein
VERLCRETDIFGSLLCVVSDWVIHTVLYIANEHLDVEEDVLIEPRTFALALPQPLPPLQWELSRPPSAQLHVPYA